MFRKSFAAAFLVSTLPLAAESEVLRALPVDPSEITPEEKIAPAAEPPAPVAEIVPLEPGTVKLPPRKAGVKTDAPEIANLPEGEDAIRLQIFLDQSNFGPGVIDGKPGRFTILAVNAWNEVHGHPAGEIGPVMAAARKAVPHPFARAVVTYSRRSTSIMLERSRRARAGAIPAPSVIAGSTSDSG